jgi:hypothetical protein
VFGSRKSLDVVRELHPKCGIIPRAIDYIFRYIHDHIDDVQFHVTISFLQIYMEIVTDLLEPRNKPKAGL